ncbi:MAG: ATP-binding cassette domain-containing protein [Firmicutes bacterium]|nr:ATP-binding cassette domain-containing protein [Bacillota bacterium]
MIKIEKVYKRFIANHGKKSTEFYAVNDFSLDIKDGKIYGILGQNGAGKTTLLRMVSGIMSPTKGSITVDGLKYNDHADFIKNDIAFLSGNTKLYENITPRELLSIFGKVYGIEKSKLASRITEVVELLDMKSFQDNKISNLSTGQVQRTNIARCFIHDPKYYILDEATAGLDVMSSQIIIDFIKKEKKRGKTILYSTHYMEEAENICDKVVFIDHGKKILEGTPKKIMKDTKTTNLRDAFFKIVGGHHEN